MISSKKSKHNNLYCIGEVTVNLSSFKVFIINFIQEIQDFHFLFFFFFVILEFGNYIYKKLVQN